MNEAPGVEELAKELWKSGLRRSAALIEARKRIAHERAEETWRRLIEERAA